MRFIFNTMRRYRDLRREKENRRFREVLERVKSNCITKDEMRMEDINFTKKVIGQTGKDTVFTDYIDKYLITTKFNSGEGKLLIFRNGTVYKANISSVSVDFTHNDGFKISYTIEDSEEEYSKNYGDFDFVTSKREDENGNIIWGFGAGSEYNRIIIEVLK